MTRGAGTFLTQNVTWVSCELFWILYKWYKNEIFIKYYEYKTQLLNTKTIMIYLIFI
jgi:hypothetical protein